MSDDYDYPPPRLRPKKQVEFHCPSLRLGKPSADGTGYSLARPSAPYPHDQQAQDGYSGLASGGGNTQQYAPPHFMYPQAQPLPASCDEGGPNQQSSPRVIRRQVGFEEQPPPRRLYQGGHNQPQPPERGCNQPPMPASQPVSAQSVYPSLFAGGEGGRKQTAAPYGVAPGAVPLPRVLQEEDSQTKVELTLVCSNLLNKDFLSKSDPCAVLYMFKGGEYKEVGRTEVVKDCLDPRFTRTFVVDYHFEKVQKLKISVYDVDSADTSLRHDDFLGEVETTLGQVVCKRCYAAPLQLFPGRKAGKGVIKVIAEEIKRKQGTVEMHFHAKNLDKKDVLGKSDPYLKVLRKESDDSWREVFKTEVVEKNLNPTWLPFSLSEHTMCGGNHQRDIRFEVYDWDNIGSHDYIGGFTTTLDIILKASNEMVSWDCVNEKKKNKAKSYVNSGVVTLSSCRMIRPYSFLDFVSGGMEINFTVGIDFTVSNGSPGDRKSRHYISLTGPNDYMTTIRAVGTICEDYDTDKQYPVLGFGAKLPPDFDEVQHEFAVNLKPENPYCHGVSGVLDAYYQCIQQVRLCGPTLFAPIINRVLSFASEAKIKETQKGAHAYFILLLLTDGGANDIDETKEAIVTASGLPMSIIIVGVGNGNFSSMKELEDSKERPLRGPTGNIAERDIVQFVPFCQYKEKSAEDLALALMGKIPRQVEEYYKMNALNPKQPSR
ncbi:copine-3-like [Babylonia areolata]|uniref:copine-3-like n=1 Tax=Babylonia areolata TaxID=304850 RepID=UPI003FD34637